MKKIITRWVLPIVFFSILVFHFADLQAELIEPTRSLKSSPEDPGRLTVFSEPPGLDVRLDGRLVGKTPLRIEAVDPQAHRLQVAASVTEVNVEPGETYHISLFKNKFIQFQVAKKEVEEPSEAKKASTSETWTPEASPEQLKTKKENRQAWERWMRFVNGTSRHF